MKFSNRFLWIDSCLFALFMVTGETIATAQNVGINTSSPLTTLHVDLGESHSNGILFTGNEPSGGIFPSLGSGRRLMYFPGKSAFRVGSVEDTQWDNAFVGANSVAFGFNTIGRAPGSFATGDDTRALGSISTTFGSGTITKGYSSVVLGMFNDSIITGSNQDFALPTTPLFMIGNGDGNNARHTALAIYKNGNFLLQNPTAVLGDPGSMIPPVTGSGTRMMWMPEKSAFRLGTVDSNVWDADSIGTWSTAIGYNTKAKGQVSLALGALTTASGVFSTAMGIGTLASGLSSTALGYSTVASGENSIAMGSVTKSSGANATAIGFATHASSYGSFALGRFNDTIVSSNSTAWIGSDPLLIVGNGTDSVQHNAFVIYKNGNIVAKNPTTVYEAGIVPLPIEGPGTRMMWLPEKGAFRAGTTLTSWNAAKIGTSSFASGAENEASGYYASAMGLASVASGLASVALGSSAVATGDVSVSLGNSNFASGTWSTAMGFHNYASSTLSTVFGMENIAKGYATTVLGMHNDPILSIDEVEVAPLTPLFIIGNGDPGQRRNALVVRKDGHVGIGTNAPLMNLHVDAGSNTSEGILVSGNYSTMAHVPNLGAGSRMMFVPGKAAFRAGQVSGTQWDNTNAGVRSFAVGYNTRASGQESSALGSGSIASGPQAFASGQLTIASGTASTAMGAETKASGDFSTAIGRLSEATGEYATAIGYNNRAGAYGSFAAGQESKSTGTVSTAMGYRTAANSSYSTALGSNTIAKGYASTVVGVFNDSMFIANQNSITNSTPLFLVGNGDASLRKNALVVYKNGNTEMNGYTRLGDSTATSIVPKIKMKKLTGTSDGAQNGYVFVSHGIAGSKILSVDIVMTVPGFVRLPPFYTWTPGYEYQFQIGDSSIVVINSATNSGNILLKSFTILIVYEE